mgnify:FL=1
MESLKEYCETAGCAYLENEPMSAHTTFRIGGKADVFIKPASEEVLKGVLAALKETGVPYYCIGGGSNLLVSDFGIRGAALYTGGFSDMALLDGCVIECGAGVKLSRMCSFALENSLSGCEFAWGIPGTVGGAVYMNAGAYGGEVKDIIVSARHMTPDGEIEEVSAENLKLGYRTSVYDKNKNVILSAKFKLHPGDKNEIREKMDDLLARRKDKQPIDLPSAGSTFKRPEGHFAGALIEQCGLKGTAVGGAMVSEKHAGFVVNANGEATCSEVLRLIELVKNTVFEKTGVLLEPEVKVVK